MLVIMKKRQKNLRGVDLNLLTVFEAIVEHRQLSAAGAHLGLSQPAMSAALQRLRIMLGDELFIRTKYGMEPTSKAEDWYEMIVPVLDQLRNGFSKQDENPENSIRVFQIIAGDYFEKVFLTPLLTRLAEYAPNVSVSISPLSNDGIPQDFRFGKHDFAMYRVLPPGKGIEHEMIGSEELVVISRKNHPRILAALTSDQFQKEKHVVMESPRHAHYGLNTLVQATPLKRTIIATVTSFGAAALLVESTDALCTVPRGLVPFLTSRFRLDVHAFPGTLTPINRLLMWPSVLAKDPMHHWFKEQLLTVVRSAESTM